jgi:hypothetical protein
MAGRRGKKKMVKVPASRAAMKARKKKEAKGKNNY